MNLKEGLGKEVEESQTETLMPNRHRINGRRATKRRNERKMHQGYWGTVGARGNRKEGEKSHNQKRWKV